MKEKTPLQIEAIEKETRSFVCPCCKAHLQFRARMQVVSVGLATTTEEINERDARPPTKSKKELFVESQNDLMQTAKSLGVFDAFITALEATEQPKPENQEYYFLNWLSSIVRQRTPQFALRQCLIDRDLEGAGDLDLWGFQNVSVVLSDGEFKVFIPKQLINGEIIEKIEISSNGIKKVPKTNLTTWIRTRFGYIERSKEFASELRKHSIGAFAK